MAKNEAKIKFIAETGNFNNSIKQSKDQMSLLNAQMKLNDTQMKATGASVEGLQQKQKLLTEKQKEQQKVVEALNGKLQKAVECFGENSTEAMKLKTQLVKAQTEEEKMSQAVDKCNDELKEQKKAADNTEKANDELADSLDDVEDSADRAGGALEKIGGVAKGTVKGVAAIGAAVTGALGAFVATAEATREYREDMAKLQTGFQSAGHSAEAATEIYKDFFSVLGEEDRSVEAVNHLAQLTNNQQELDKWTTICAGVWGTFGDSLPIEGLTEAANETAKVGKVTGPLADALNWAGISEDAFNEKLAACNSEQERATLITQTLNDKYTEAAEKYRELNGDVMDSQKAQSELTDAMAGVGAAAEPVMTSFKLMGAGILTSLTPAVDLIGEGLTGILNGADGAAETLADGLGDGLSTVVSSISQAMPQITSVIGTLFPALLSMISSNLPVIVSSIGGLAVELISGLASQLPILITTLVSVISTLLTSLGAQMPTLIPILITGILDAILAIFQNADLLIDGAIALVKGLVNGILTALPILIDMLPTITQSLLDALLNGEASLINMVFELVPVICLSILQMLPDLLVAVTKIVVSLGSFIVERVVNYMSIMWENIKGLFSGVGSWFSDNVTGPLVEKFTGVWKKLKDGAKNAWQGIKDTFGKVASWFGEKFGSAWTKVKNVFSTGGKIFDGIKEGISSAFTKTVNKIISGVNKVVSVPFNAINNALNKIRNVSIAGLSPFSGLPTVSVPKIPLFAEGGILTRPTLNIAGEAGPEAIIPIEKLQSFMDGALERTLQRDNISQLVATVERLADRPIELSINGHKFATATAADTDTVNGGRIALRQRGLAL